MRQASASTLWGVAAVALTALTSVFAGGWFLVTRTTTVTSKSVSVSATDTSLLTPTTVPTTIRRAAEPAPKPAPLLVVPHRSVTPKGWVIRTLLAVLLVFVAVPVLMRNSVHAQAIRLWTARIFGVGALVTIQFIGLLFLPALGALSMAARTGRSPSTNPDASVKHGGLSDASGSPRHDMLWFAAWSAIGGLFALSLLGAASIGVFLLVVPVVATVLLFRIPQARVGRPGLITGVSLPMFFVAYLNRHGPGNICNETRLRCHEEWNPWPWVLVGIVAASTGAVAYVRTWKSR
jgi:hypothetical protein